MLQVQLWNTQNVQRGFNVGFQKRYYHINLPVVGVESHFPVSYCVVLLLPYAMLLYPTFTEDWCS